MKFQRKSSSPSRVKRSELELLAVSMMLQRWNGSYVSMETRRREVIFGVGVTCNGGEVGRGGHGQHRGGDVLGLDAVHNQLIQVGGVHVLVIVPPEAVEGDEQQLLLCRLPQGSADCAAGCSEEKEHLQPHLHLHSNCVDLHRLCSSPQETQVNVQLLTETFDCEPEDLIRPDPAAWPWLLLRGPRAAPLIQRDS